jgi:hypothetical protein
MELRWCERRSGDEEWHENLEAGLERGRTGNQGGEAKELPALPVAIIVFVSILVAIVVV